MPSADCQICKYVSAQGQSSSGQKVDLCLSVPSSPSFHFLHPFSPSCREHELASPDLHMISSCYLLPLPIHNFVTPPCTHSGNRQHPCCPGCCPPPSHARYLLCTSPCSPRQFAQQRAHVPSAVTGVKRGSASPFSLPAPVLWATARGQPILGQTAGI